ncbi:MAG TPA: pitrilysin family protein, partial [Methanomassiliicoccales archaeon]|nr:pitrilysin family protein [Methanomassiliicoccales archaeon]
SHDLLMKTVWKGNPMADPEAGYVKCVEEMRSDQIRDFFNGNYRPPNMAVVATGKVNVDQVVRWASESFDSLPKAKPRSERTAPAFRPSIELHPREGDQAYVAVGFPGVMASHPDRYVQGLVSGILAGGTSSRLYQKVREEKGLVYSIYSMTYAFSDTGMSSLFFSTSEDETVEVMRIIASELRSLKEDGLEKDELDRAKHWFKGMIVRRLESSVENRMFFLGEVYLQTGKALTGEQVLDRVGKVTEEDVARVGESLLKRENMGLALHANGKSSKGVIDQLSAVDF